MAEVLMFPTPIPVESAPARGRGVELRLPPCRLADVAAAQLSSLEEARTAKAESSGLVDAAASWEEGGSVVNDAVWIGAEPVQVRIGPRSFNLTLVFLGSWQIELEGALIDPTLPLADTSGEAEPVPDACAYYADFTPAQRQWYLKWIEDGCRERDVPEAFLLHRVTTLEAAIVIQERHEDLTAARALLENLVAAHKGERDFSACAESLLEVCAFIDPAKSASPVYAGETVNFGGVMPFKVRHYLAEALARSRYLEADQALLFMLQQPNTRLEAHVAHNFGALYRVWVEDYPLRFDRGIELEPENTLALVYRCLDDENVAEYHSDLPDPGTARVPADLRTFFLECCRALDELRGLPVAQQTRLAKAIQGRALVPGGKPTYSLRPDYDVRLVSRLQGTSMVLVRADEVLSDLFEDLDLPLAKQVPGPLLTRLLSILDEIGIAMEPDPRFGLPAKVRPVTDLALFRQDYLPGEEPSEPFHIAQAAIVLSAIGASAFPGLKRNAPADIEACRPLGHRFSDRELERLAATSLFMRHVDDARALLARWPRSMKKNQRVSDIDRGFAIAFHAQAGDPLLKRFATAVSKALHADDRRVGGLLLAVAEQREACSAIDSSERTRNDEGEGTSVTDLSAATHAQPTSGVVPFRRPITARPSSADLHPGAAEVLRALMRGPKPRSELGMIAGRHQLQIGAALERINNWSFERLKASATRGGSTVRINPVVFDALELELGASS